MIELPPLPPGHEPFVIINNVGRPMFRYQPNTEALCWEGLTASDKLLFSSVMCRLWMEQPGCAATNNAYAWRGLA